MATGTAVARRLDNTRRRMRLQSETAERRLVIAGSSAAIGFLEQRNTLPLSVFNLPSKLVIGIGATLAEGNTSGTTRRMLGAIADAAFALYGYQAAKTNSFIAGDDDDDYVGDQEYVGEV
jgi:hypothetical protein